MTKPLRWALMGVLLVAVSLSPRSGADEKPTLVGKVIDVDGPVLMTNRMTEDRWYQGYIEMPTYLSERLKADSKTSATIQFYKGGRAVISPGTQVEVITTKSLQTLKVEMGTVWAKFDQQQTEFRIQTAGGVMGIEGTEFFVEAGEDGETTLTVVEGKVRLLSGDDERVVGDGEEANFQKGVRRFQRFAAGKGSLAERRQAAFKKLALEGKPFQQYVLTRGLIKRKRKRLSTLFFRRLLPRRSAQQLQVTLQNIQRGRRRPTRSFELATLEQPDGKPSISWNRGLAPSFAVALSSDEEGEDVLWQGNTNVPSFVYPDYGPELEAGKTYYVGVTPLRLDGSAYLDPEGRSLWVTSSFRAEGHQPEYSKITGMEVAIRDGFPEFTWSGVEAAAAYQVRVLADSEPVWVGETEISGYLYPETARALDPGQYQVVVEGFDEFGIKMAESEPMVFATEGWSSMGMEGPPRE